MFDNRLLYILSRLSKKEIARLGRFVNSKYFHRSKKIVKLYAAIIKYYPKFNHPEFTKENIYTVLSSKKKFNDSTFRALMHDFLDLVYKFLLVEDIDIFSLDNKIDLLKILLNRKLFSAFEGEVNKIEKEFENSGKDFYYLNNRYLLESYKYNYILNQVRSHNRSNVYRERELFESSESYLTLMFMVELISDYVNVKINADKYSNIEVGFPEKILSSINVDFLMECINQKDVKVMAKLYSMIYKLYSSDSDFRMYKEYKDYLINNSEQLNQDEKFTHFNMLISYCIYANKKAKNEQFVEELFNIYEYFLMNEIYIHSGYQHLSNFLYRNIIINAIRFGKYKWLENFVTVYSNKVNENQRDNMYNYGMSLLYSELGKYSEALTYMNKLQLEDFIFKYDIYTRKARILFSYDSLIPLTDHINAFKRFLRHDPTMLPTYKKTYRNFINIILELAYFREGRKNYQLDEIKNRISVQEQISGKQWLMEQINYLEKGSKTEPVKNKEQAAEMV